jgi:hypothetical protein
MAYENGAVKVLNINSNRIEISVAIDGYKIKEESQLLQVNANT